VTNAKTWLHLDIVKELEVQDLKFGVEERAPAVFEPDTLLPSQYVDRVRGRREYDPERRLMVAVLESAVNDYVKAAGARDPQRQELFCEVEQWVESRDPSWLFSFENICDVLDLDPEYLRGGLHARKQRASRTQPEGKRPAPSTIHNEEEELWRASA
jgi:hypothetical protein